MASVSASRSVSSASTVTVAVSWLARQRTRSTRQSRLALRRLARFLSAEGNCPTDMPRDHVAIERGDKYLAQF